MLHTYTYETKVSILMETKIHKVIFPRYILQQIYLKCIFLLNYFYFLLLLFSLLQQLNQLSNVTFLPDQLKISIIRKTTSHALFNYIKRPLYQKHTLQNLSGNTFLCKL